MDAILFYDQADALEQLIRKSVREELKCGDMRQTVATAEPEELPDQVLDLSQCCRRNRKKHMGRRDAMSRMVVVTLPEDQVNQLEFLAKEESNRIGKEVTMTDLAERAVRQQIKRMKQRDRKKIRACIDRARKRREGCLLRAGKT